MKLCSIASGSSGNCIFAGSETTSLLIDAGISGKRVEAGLAVLDRSAKELDGILVTHEHSDYTVQNLTGLDAVLLEANHDENMLAVGPYPYPLKQRIAGAKGHLSNLAAGHLLCEILHDNLQEVLLGHLSKENNYEALAFETVACEVTTGDNPYHSGDFHLAVAKRSEVSPLIEV